MANYPKVALIGLISEICVEFNSIFVASLGYDYFLTLADIKLDKQLLSVKLLRALRYAFIMVGAFVADSWFGKYYTLMGFLIGGCVCGSLLLIFLTVKTSKIAQGFGFLGIVLSVTGHGGIKACLPSFLGDQFVLPEQMKIQTDFWSYFLIALFIGINLGQLVLLVLEEKIGITLCSVINAVVIIVGTVPLLVIKKRSQMIKPERHVIVHSLRCIFNAIKEKIKSDEKHPHWLDHSKTTYEESFVENVKITLNMTVLLLPFFLFRMIRDKLIVDWRKQTNNMSDIRSDCNFIAGAEMEWLGIILTPIFITLYCFVIFPLCKKCGLQPTSLRCLGLGGILLAICYLISGCLNYHIDQDIGQIPQNKESYFKLFNPLNCKINLNMAPYINNLEIDSMGYKFLNLHIDGKIEVEYEIKGCGNLSAKDQILIKEKSVSLVKANPTGPMTILPMFPGKRRDGSAAARIVRNYDNGSVEFTRCGKKIPLYQNNSRVQAGIYKVNNFDEEIFILRGGKYIILVMFNENQTEIQNVKSYQVQSPHQWNVLNQIPQYVIYCKSMALVEPAALTFTYSEAPASMKTTMVAMWYSLLIIGEVFFVIVFNTHNLANMTIEIFVLSSLSFIFMMVFAFLAVRYNYSGPRSASLQNDSSNSDVVT